MKRIAITGCLVWLASTLPAAAAPFYVNFCPGGSGCPTGVTEASLTFTNYTNPSNPTDPNDYLLDIVITGDGTAPMYVDELSFTTNAPTPAGYESPDGYSTGGLPVLLSAPSGGNPWTVFFSNVSASAKSCTVSNGVSQEVCIQSDPKNLTGTPNSWGAPLQNQTLHWSLIVDLAAGYTLDTTQVNLRAQFLNADGSNAGILSPGGVGTTVPEPTTLTLLGAGLAAVAFGKRRRSISV